MLFKEITVVYSENHTEPINTKYGVTTYSSFIRQLIQDYITATEAPLF
jgi:hypothetical protein